MATLGKAFNGHAMPRTARANTLCDAHRQLASCQLGRDCCTSVMPFSSRRDADAEPTRATARVRMQNIRAAIATSLRFSHTA